MRIVAVQFPDGTDTTQLPIGKAGVTVSDGTNSVSGGLILSVVDVYEPPPILVPHTHDAQTLVSPAP